MQYWTRKVSLKRNCLLIAGSLILLSLASLPKAQAQIVWNPSNDVNVKIGLQGQMWGDETQSPETGGYAQNFYLRRIRFIVAGDIGKDIYFFFETDDPNLGKTPKALNTGFLVQDAFLEWKAKNWLRLDGGIILVPFSHNGLQSTVSYFTLDLSPVATVNNTSTQSAALRDTGFQLRGFLLKDKLLYRVGVFDGVRNADARNSLRSAGYVQYNFVGTEKSYVLPGTTLGKTKLLAVSGGFDTQGSYRAFSSHLGGAVPVNGGDEIGGQVQYLHYDGKTEFTAIPDQNDVLVEGAYYVRQVKLQPFGKMESQNFVASQNLLKDVNRYGAGANYYVHAQNLKFTFQYLRAEPRHSTLHATNEFTVQLQLYYF